jgi:Uma2 family endonuclease
MAEPMRAENRRFTYADLITWASEERWELIEGVGYAMTPAPSQRHQEIVVELAGQIWAFLRDHPCRVFTAPFDVRLPAPGEDGMTASTVFQPDLLVVCEREKLDGRGVVGAPSLIIEVTSPATAGRDLREKRLAYEHAGVVEYWVISPADATVQVYTLDAHGRYGAPAVYTREEQVPVGVLPELRVDLARVFAEQ